MFADVSSGNGSYFKAENYTDKVLLLEVESFRNNVPTSFGPKDEAQVTITVFEEGQYDTPVRIDESVKIQQTALAANLASKVGQKAVVRLGKGNAKPGKQAPWVWNTAKDAYEGVGAYVTARDAALAEAPSFG